MDLDFEKETNTGCLLRSLEGEKKRMAATNKPNPRKKGVSFSDPFEITKLWPSVHPSGGGQKGGSVVDRVLFTSVLMNSLVVFN